MIESILILNSNQAMYLFIINASMLRFFFESLDMWNDVNFDLAINTFISFNPSLYCRMFK